MSVLIKGMEMPKCCMDCTLNYDQMSCSVTGTGWWSDSMMLMDFDSAKERLYDCPLIEVPTPHGELVDRGGLIDIYADRLTAVAERYSPDSSECGILSGAMKLLAIQPTVIEAEGES